MRDTIFRCFLILGLGGIGSLVDCNHEFSQPNILLIITDDQSWKHLSCYGDPVVRTPTIDSLAQAGLRFQHAYTAAPSCSPSRAGILTGQDIYRLEEGGVLTGFIRDKFVVFPSLLENAGYAVGGTGKKYWPKTKDVPNAHNLPVGKTYSDIRLRKVPDGISKTDYAENFKVFLTQKNSSKPFFFWVGISEPHIPHPKGLGVKKGINPERINVPSFYPDIPLVRSALADYLYEIEWADQSIAKVLQVLVANGYQNNTLVVFTSDNGMPFPRAKATLYDWGVRMPLIMAWGDQIHNHHIVNSPVSLIDLAPTFLELAGVEIPGQMTGKSLVDIMLNGASEKLDSHRNFVVTAIEKHTHARRDSLGFPRRAIHTQEWPTSLITSRIDGLQGLICVYSQLGFFMAILIQQILKNIWLPINTMKMFYHYLNYVLGK